MFTCDSCLKPSVDEDMQAGPSSGEVDFVVRFPSGKEAGTFALPAQALCSELKRAISDAVGLPSTCQQLVIGDDKLADEQPLYRGGLPSEPVVNVVLIVEIPKPRATLTRAWKLMPGSSTFLEDLEVNQSREGNQTEIIPASRIGCVGMDPDSGLLVIVGAGDELEFKGKGKGKGKGEVMDGDDDGAAGKGKGTGKGKGKDIDGADDGAAGKGTGKCKGKGKDIDGDDDSAAGKGEGKGTGKGKDIDGDGDGAAGKGKGKGKSKGKFTYRNLSRNSLFVIPPDSDPYFLVTEPGHPIISAVEMHAAACAQGSPLPSLGLGVALVTGHVANDSGPLTLCSYELCPVALKWTPLSEGADCEAVCLDRSVSPPRAIAAELRPGGERHVVFHQLRAGPPGGHPEEFRMSAEASANRVTSIAWSPASSAVLVTRAGEHAIYVYRKAAGEWQWVSTLGERSSRGSQDGHISDVRFWFPSSEEPIVEFPYGAIGKDSCPLVPGPEGAIFVYSGGSLMVLASDLSSARKVTSMREELWMTEDDEGTPQFPVVCNVFGVHQGKVYRRLCRTDFREAVLIRRLAVSDQLRAGRSHLRLAAPRIWPNLTEARVYDIDEKGPDYFGACGAARPRFCHEEDRDKWDGNSRWLQDEWLA